MADRIRTKSVVEQSPQTPEEPVTTAQKTNTTPIALISSANLQPGAQVRERNTNDVEDNVHVRFATNIGRVLHARCVRELGRLLTRHPNLVVACTDNLITIPSPAAHGFTMSIVTDRGRCTVVFGEWEDDFTAVEEAVGLIEDALHGDIRLRVDVDEHDTRWTLERRLPDGTWMEQPRASLPETLKFLRGRRRTTTYLHNDFRRIAWNAIS